MGIRCVVLLLGITGAANGAGEMRVSATSSKATGCDLFRHKNRSMTVSKDVLGNPTIRIISDLPHAFLIHSMHTPHGQDGFFDGSPSSLVSGA